METEYDKKKKFIFNIIYIFLLGIIIYSVLKYGINLLSPFIGGFLIAYLLKNPSRFIADRFKVPQKIITIMMVIIFYSTVGVIISLIGIKLISGGIAIVYQLPTVYKEQFEPFLTTMFQRIEHIVYRLDPDVVQVLNEGFNQFISSLGENITNLSLSTLGFLSSIMSSLPTLLIKILLMIISTFFIAIDYDKLSNFILRQFDPRGKELVEQIKRYILNILFVVIRSYVLIMTITFVELSIGLSIIGIPNAILIAFIVAIFDILPVLGTGGIMIPWAIITLIQGQYQLAIGLIVVYIIVTIVRNILEPKIVGEQLGLHPVITLMSMFVGANLFGVVGLFGFPIALSLVVHLNNSGTIKLLK